MHCAGADPGVGEDKATDDYMAALDVVGYNYSPQRYKQDHARLPDRVIVATETFPVRLMLSRLDCAFPSR